MAGNDPRLRYFVARQRGNAAARYYWQPSADLRAAGWQPYSLGNDLAAAEKKAAQLNAEVDAWRKAGTPAMFSGPRFAKPKVLVRRPQGRAPRSGVSGIYVVRRQGGGGIKIGIAADILGRVVALQTGSADRLVLHFYIACKHEQACTIERRLHDAYAARRLHGEWFDVDPDEASELALCLRAGIQENVQDLGAPEPLPCSGGVHGAP